MCQRWYPNFLTASRFHIELVYVLAGLPALERLCIRTHNVSSQLPQQFPVYLVHLT